MPPLLMDLEVLFDPSNCTSTAQAIVTDTPASERQCLRDEDLSTSLGMFSLSMGIGPHERAVAIQAIVYLMYIELPSCLIILVKIHNSDHKEQQYECQ